MKRACLTFDVDWACDEVLEYFLDLIKEYAVAATINITHNTKLLKRINDDSLLEMGIHPNFNRLLNGEMPSENCGLIVDELLNIVPDAVCVRSHSLVKSTQLTSLFSQKGLKYESNLYIPPQDGMSVAPFFFEGMWQLPILYEDDLYLHSREKRTADYFFDEKYASPRVFNFHPIHLFLNTEEMSRYNAAKKFYHEYDRLTAFVNNDGWGIRAMFEEIIEEGFKHNYSFCTVSSYMEEYTSNACCNIR